MFKLLVNDSKLLQPSIQFDHTSQFPESYTIIPWLSLPGTSRILDSSPPSTLKHNPLTGVRNDEKSSFITVLHNILKVQLWIWSVFLCGTRTKSSESSMLKSVKDRETLSLLTRPRPQSFHFFFDYSQFNALLLWLGLWYFPLRKLFLTITFGLGALKPAKGIAVPISAIPPAIPSISMFPPRSFPPILYQNCDLVSKCRTLVN